MRVLSVKFGQEVRVDDADVRCRTELLVDQVTFCIDVVVREG